MSAASVEWLNGVCEDKNQFGPVGKTRPGATKTTTRVSADPINVIRSLPEKKYLTSRLHGIRFLLPIYRNGCYQMNIVKKTT
jgi:hypothetical protein